MPLPYYRAPALHEAAYGVGHCRHTCLPLETWPTSREAVGGLVKREKAPPASLSLLDDMAARPAEPEEPCGGMHAPHRSSAQRLPCPVGLSRQQLLCAPCAWACPLAYALRSAPEGHQANGLWTL